MGLRSNAPRGTHASPTSASPRSPRSTLSSKRVRQSAAQASSVANGMPSQHSHTDVPSEDAHSRSLEPEWAVDQYGSLGEFVEAERLRLPRWLSWWGVSLFCSLHIIGPAALGLFVGWAVMCYRGASAVRCVQSPSQPIKLAREKFLSNIANVECHALLICWRYVFFDVNIHVCVCTCVCVHMCVCAHVCVCVCVCVHEYCIDVQVTLPDTAHVYIAHTCTHVRILFDYTHTHTHTHTHIHTHGSHTPQSHAHIHTHVHSPSHRSSFLNTSALSLPPTTSGFSHPHFDPHSTD